MATSGYKVVLSADRVLMASYPTLFDGMMASVQTTSVPRLVMRRLMAPPLASADGRASRAPLGLRRLEAALRRAGMGEQEVIVVTPERLADAIGPDTRLVCLCSGDPLGRGMSTTTMAPLQGGQPYTQHWFAALCRTLGRLRKRYDFRVLAGGPGAWQLAGDADKRAELGIDAVFVGYAEAEAPAVIADLLAGRSQGGVFTAGRSCPAEQIPPILAASVMGAVEISRGCGRGCGFCSLASEPMTHLSIAQVLADVQTNLRAGQRNLCLISEDFLRYGAAGQNVSPPALIELLRAIRGLEGVELLQLDHVSVSAVCQFPPEQLRAVREALVGRTSHQRIWVNLGVETAAEELLRVNGLGGKVRPFELRDWPALCERAVDRLIEAGFTPMVSLVLGMPGERAEHVEQTVELAERLHRPPTMIFPMFYAPLNPLAEPFGPAGMTAAHWRLLRRAYALNFRTVPPVFADNHRAGHAPWWRRAFIQSAGRVQTIQWKLRLAKLARRARV